MFHLNHHLKSADLVIFWRGKIAMSSPGTVFDAEVLYELLAFLQRDIQGFVQLLGFHVMHAEMWI